MRGGQRILGTLCVRPALLALPVLSAELHVAPVAAGLKRFRPRAAVLALVILSLAVLANSASATNGSISGGVRDNVTSLPISGATVRLEQSSVIKYTTTSQADGTYSISNVTAGTYLLVGLKAGYDNWSQTKTIDAGQNLTGQNIAMVPQATISGGVRDSVTRVAIAGATVRLEQSSVIKYTTTSQADGTYSISNVTAGTYLLVGLQTGYNNWSQNVTLSPGQNLTGQNIAMVAQILAAPMLTSPLTGDTLQAASVPAVVTLRWQAVSGASGYELSVDGVQVLIDDGAQNSYQATLSGFGSHNWKARTKNGSGQYGAWSNLETFTLQQSGLPAPVLLAPDRNATISFPAENLNGHTINFAWSAVTGAAHYELLVDNDSGFASKEINQTNLSSSTTSYQTGSNFLPSGTYYWKVLACPASGPCAESETRTFYVTYADYPAPVFVPWNRFYSSTARAHCYRTGLGCSGYTFEKVEGYVSDRPFPGSVPLMRLYDPVHESYRYVVSMAKRDEAIIAGYPRYDGIAAYAYATGEFGTVGLRHLYKGSPDYDDFLCISKTEIASAISNYGFSDQNNGQPIAYVSPTGLANPVGHRRVQGSIGGIDSGTGAFRDSYSQQALAYNGYGPPFAFTLHYNSQNGMAVPISPGWSHSLYSFIVEAPNGDIVVKWGDGSESFFAKQGDGTFLAMEAGNYDKLTCVAPSGAGCVIDPVNRGYNLVRKDQSRFIFREIPVSAPSVFVPSVALIRVEDRHGNATTISFLGDSGLMNWAQDAAGRQLNFTYDPQYYRLSQVTDSALNRSLHFDYDAAGNLWHFTDARGNVTTFTYDTDHRLLTVTRPRGNTPRTVDYDGVGRVWRLRDGFGRTALEAQYDFGGTTGTTRLTSPNVPGRQVDLSHSSQADSQKDVLTGMTDAYGQDALRSLPDPTAANATLPRQLRDFRQNPPTELTYDGQGNVKTLTDARGKTAYLDYDSYNNLTSRTDFGSPTRTTTYLWDAAGKTLTDINAINDSGTRNTHFTYNAKGLPTSVREGRGFTTGLNYDAQFNLASVTDPENNTTQYEYDAAGRLTAVIDAKLKRTDYKYDLNDNLIEVKDHDRHVVSLSYNSNNDLEQISYVRGGVQDTIQYTYDANDRLETVTDPWNGVYRYAYNDAGDLISRTDPKGQVTSYSYDNNGRLQRVDYQSDGKWVQFGYDPNGNLISMDESWIAGSQGFVYDGLDRLTSHTNTFGQTVGYGYDDASNRTFVTYPGSKTVQYEYDLAKRLQRVTDWNSGVVEYGYDLANNLTSVTNPNGTRSTFNYDRASRLTSILHQKSDLSTIASFDFDLDPVGNHNSETVTAPIPLSLPAAEDITYTVDKDNRLASQSDGVSYGYDTNGNRTSKSGPGGSATYGYDLENHLTSVSAPTPVSYVYDGLGNRIAKTEGGTTTRYVLDLFGSMSQVLAETDDNNNVRAYYIYGHGLVAKIDAQTGQRYTYHADSRGSTVAITDASQNFVAKYAYDEFGGLANSDVVPGFANPFNYVGQWGVMAEANGLRFMRARYYDASTGTFITRDPLGFPGGDFNPYAYVRARPLTAIDPLGTAGTESLSAPTSGGDTYLTTGYTVFQEKKIRLARLIVYMKSKISDPMTLLHLLLKLLGIDADVPFSDVINYLLNKLSGQESLAPIVAADKLVDEWFTYYLSDERGATLLKKLGRARQGGGGFVDEFGMYETEGDIMYQIENLKVRPNSCSVN